MIGSLMMCVSVVILLAGMIAGIAMGIQQNFILAPAHADSGASMPDSRMRCPWISSVSPSEYNCAYQTGG